MSFLEKTNRSQTQNISVGAKKKRLLFGTEKLIQNFSFKPGKLTFCADFHCLI